MKKKNMIGVVGLGYVGLPLITLLSSKFEVIGYDNNIERIKQLQQNIDANDDIDLSKFRGDDLKFTSSIELLSNCSVIIVLCVW